MRLIVQPAALPATLLLGVFILLGSCAMFGKGPDTGTKRTAVTTSMQTVENDIRESVLQVDATGSSLQDLIKPGQIDVKMAFDKYSDNVVKMEQMGNQLMKHTDEMSVRRSEYFTEWEKRGDTYTNPQIQELSEQRRADLGKIFDEIPEARVGVKGALQTYLSDIKEIQNYLSNDLTPNGIGAITPIAQKSITDGDNLKEAVKPVLSALERARGEMLQGGTK